MKHNNNSLIMNKPTSPSANAKSFNKTFDQTILNNQHPMAQTISPKNYQNQTLNKINRNKPSNRTQLRSEHGSRNQYLRKGKMESPEKPSRSSSIQNLNSPLTDRNSTFQTEDLRARMRLFSARTSRSRERSFYDNYAGPGSYNIPTLVGQKCSDSAIQNVPCYSFPQQRTSSKLYISKRHEEHMPNEESPGVGTYSPNKLNVTLRSPTFRVGSDHRFTERNSLSKYKLNLPSSYVGFSTISPKLVRNNISNQTQGKLSRDGRFKEIPEFKKIPGPATYQTEKYHSVEDKLRNRGAVRTTFGTTINSTENENKKSLIKAKFPGPANYNANFYYTRQATTNHQFTKAKREENSKHLTPGPNAYTFIEVGKYKGSHSRHYSFGRSDREFNFARFHNLNSVFQRRFLETSHKK